MSSGLRFGVFPLGLAAGPDGLASGPPDDRDQIAKAFAQLQGDGPPLLVRIYVSWSGAAATGPVLRQVQELAAAGLSWDLVLSYRDPDGEIGAWTDFVSRVVRGYGSCFAAVQITGETNLASAPAAADGAFPNAVEAFVHGLVVARAAQRESSATADIGFAVVPETDPAGGKFWPKVAALGGEQLADAVDYAGLDMYPDVFGPRFALYQLDGAVDWLLRSFREQVLPIAGIGPRVPIRICENGWPTGADRSEADQANVLEAILRAVRAKAEELNVTHWQLFTLRDADSSKDDLFHTFGVLHDDYTPKPAFHRLSQLIAELS